MQEISSSTVQSRHPARGAATPVAQRPSLTRSAAPPSGTDAVGPSAPPRLAVRWATHQEEVRAAQRLRYQVFANEMGATLRPPKGSPDGHDVDAFDDHCEHLIVSHAPAADQPEQVIGTYRLLTPAAARRAGAYYTETEFSLHGLESLRPHLAELGRSCVHPDHRTGGVILALWGALTSFLSTNQLRGVMGCASVSMQDGGHAAASLWTRLKGPHGCEPALGATPRCPLPIGDLDCERPVETPALIRGYLRCGAQLLGPPAWDADFNVADLPLFMQLCQLPDRYLRQFQPQGIRP